MSVPVKVGLGARTNLANYTITNTPGTFTITQAPLTITALDVSRQYGQPNQSFSRTTQVTLNGVVTRTGTLNGDTVTATFSTTAVLNSPVGSHPIVLVDAGLRKPMLRNLNPADLAPIAVAAVFPLELTGFGVFFAGIHRRKKKLGTQKMRLLAAILLSVAILGLTGCGCPSTVFQTYTINITANQLRSNGSIHLGPPVGR